MRKDRGEDRYSIVLFADMIDVPKFNNERFGSVQEQPVGFNYDLSMDELRRFCV
jgi:hypothetical protein